MPRAANVYKIMEPYLKINQVSEQRQMCTHLISVSRDNYKSTSKLRGIDIYYAYESSCLSFPSTFVKFSLRVTK
jgi:hypothetical protein